MISLWWSFLLTTIGVVGLALVYRRPASIVGPAIGIGVQLLWIAYAVVSGQWWFLVSAFTYGSVNIDGLRTRLAQRTPRPSVGVGVLGGALTLTEVRELAEETAHWPAESEVELAGPPHARTLTARHPQEGRRG